METKRPTSPAAEEIVGGYFPVLDHGFVSLVDYMGTDEDVERAARVSYGYGTRKVSATRGLIRYLRRHYHTTPSEMVELKFHCAMPMFVARQWVRHRMACLAEGTEVYFDLTGRIQKKENQLSKLPIEGIWDRFQPMVNHTRPDKQRNPYFRRDRVKGMRLRQMNEETGRIQHTRVVDVFKNGQKHVFTMVLADGKEITATADHRFRFSDEWKTLQEATGLEESGGRAVWKKGDYYVYTDGLVAKVPPLYQDEEWGAEQIDGEESDYVEQMGGGPVGTELKRRLRVVGNELTTTHLVRVERFEYVGLRETYDLEVEGPFHNFIADGIVTHNSINEYSGRYSLMPLLFYKPDLEHFALQSPENNQGRQSESAPQELYDKTVAHWERVRAEASEGYQWMVQEDVARELARIDLPLSTYTQWYWKIDLHNLFHFLKLRADPHAQWEIQEFARVMAGMLKRVAPLSYEAWLDYNVGGEPMSRAEMNALRDLLEGDEDGVRAKSDSASLTTEQLKEAGLSGREVREMVQKLQPREIPDYDLDLSEMRSAEEMSAELEEAVPGKFE